MSDTPLPPLLPGTWPALRAAGDSLLPGHRSRRGVARPGRGGGDRHAVTGVLLDRLILILVLIRRLGRRAWHGDRRGRHRRGRRRRGGAVGFGPGAPRRAAAGQAAVDLGSQVLVLRLPLLEVGEDRGSDEDRGVGAGQ